MSCRSSRSTGRRPRDAAVAARDFAAWVVDTLGVPVFLYGDVDPERRTLPDARRDAFTQRAPDLGPPTPHPTLGAIAVGARPVLVAVNCELDTGDVALARSIAHTIRERDGGLPGVRALGFMLTSRGHAQVSMNLVALERTGLQQACETVRDLARRADVRRRPGRAGGARAGRRARALRPRVPRMVGDRPRSDDRGPPRACR